jgi:hypothetical protein
MSADGIFFHILLERPEKARRLLQDFCTKLRVFYGRLDTRMLIRAEWWGSG